MASLDERGSLLGGSYPYSTSSKWLVLALPSSVPLCPTAWGGKKTTHTKTYTFRESA